MESLRDTKREQEKPKILPIILFGALGLLPLLQANLGMVFVTIAIPYYSDPNQTINELPLSENQLSWFASTTLTSYLLGTLASIHVLDKCGMKKALLASALGQALGWGLLQISQEFPALMLNRILAGISTGMAYPSCITFLSDISTPDLRGSCSIAALLVSNLTWMLALAIAGLIDFQTTILVFSCPIILFFLCYSALPESPLWLLRTRGSREAEMALIKLRGGDIDVKEEMEEMIKANSVKDEKKGINERWFSRAFVMPLAILGILFFLQVATGMEMVAYYALHIFAQLEIRVNGYLMGVLMQAATTINYLVSMLLALRTRRKPHFMLATAIFAICTFTTSSVLICDMDSQNELRQWLLCSAILGMFAAYGLGIGPVPFAVLGELLPPDLKGTGCSIIIAIRCITGSVLLKLFPSAEALLGLAGVFMLQTTMGLIALVFAALVLPETKGQSVSQIAELFQAKSDNPKDKEERV